MKSELRIAVISAIMAALFTQSTAEARLGDRLRARRSGSTSSRSGYLAFPHGTPPARRQVPGAQQRCRDADDGGACVLPTPEKIVVAEGTRRPAAAVDAALAKLARAKAALAVAEAELTQSVEAANHRARQSEIALRAERELAVLEHARRCAELAAAHEKHLQQLARSQAELSASAGIAPIPTVEVLAPAE